jgi:hypothetical protein
VLVGRAIAQASDAAGAVAVALGALELRGDREVGRADSPPFGGSTARHAVPAPGIADVGVGVGRRGQHERNLSRVLVEQPAAELAGVALRHERLALRTLASGVLNVAGGERGPPLLELDSERGSPCVDRLNERCGYPAHRVEHDIAGIAVGADRSQGELGQHLRRVAV